MNEEIKRTYESLPEEEKEQLQKYQKKGITKVTQSVDQETGEILSTETTYSSEKKRVKLIRNRFSGGTGTRPPACACPHADRLEPV